jgi:VPDSG-CTERM motif
VKYEVLRTDCDLARIDRGCSAGFSCGPLVAGRDFPLWTLKSFSSKWKILSLLYKKFLTCALLAFALALNAQAKDKDKEKYKDKYKDKEKYNVPVVSVPDNGSTVLLLGTAVLVLGLASRRMAIR